MTPEQEAQFNTITQKYGHAAPTSGAQDWYSYVKSNSATVPEPPKRGFLGEILPVGGAIVGGIAGGILGGAVGAPTVVGAPAGAFAGGVAGAAAGGALGETAQQGIEKLAGQRTSFAPGEIGKTAAEYGALEAIGGPVASIGGKVLKGAGEAIAKATVPISMKEAGLLQAYKAGAPFWQRVLAGATGAETKAPVTAAQTAFDKGLMGTEEMIGVQAKRAANNLWTKAISPALTASKTTINMPKYFSELEKEIISSTPERARQADLLTALKALQSDYKGVKDVPLAELQKFKEGWAKLVPEKAYRGQPIAGAFNDLKNMAAKKARTTIYNALGQDIKQAYFDYGNLQGLQQLGQKAMTGGQFKGGFGSFWSAVKDMAVIPSGTIGGQTIYKVGQGVELFGKPGARFVRDVIPALADVGKDVTGATTAPSQ
jgi:hypothetical protein